MLDAADQAHEANSSPAPQDQDAEASPTPEVHHDSTTEDDELDFLNWDETKPRRQRAHITADTFFDLDDEPELNRTQAADSNGQDKPLDAPTETPAAPHSAEYQDTSVSDASALKATPSSDTADDLDFLAQDETKLRPKRQAKLRPKRQAISAEDFFDLENELETPAQTGSAPAGNADAQGKSESKTQTLDELLEARREAQRRKLDQFFDFEEEEHEEVGNPNTDQHAQSTETSAQSKPLAEDARAALERMLHQELEPNEIFELSETESASGAAFEVPSEQLEGTDAPLVRAKPKALGALATLAAAAEERRTQRAARVLTDGQKRRLQRDLKALVDLDLSQALGCLKIMVSNQVTDVNEAYSTVKSLDVATDYLDLMCYDVYKVERALLNPMALALKPRLAQLLRGKNLVLFYALSLHLMLKHIFERKDAEQGGRALRHQMGLYEVCDLLQALNHVSAARRDEGLFYPDLKMHYRSLFEFAGVAPPSFEAYDDSVSEQLVHLRRSNSGR